MDQKENALQCMIEWLSHENELGKAPSQIQIAGEFDLHNLHCLLYTSFGVFVYRECSLYSALL